MTALAGEVIARFEKHCPLTVQSRVLLEFALSENSINALFHNVAEKQYEKELLFSTTVRIMTDVVLNTRSSVRQSYLARKEEIPVSLAAVYDKLAATETVTSEALVRHSYQQLGRVVEAMGAELPSWVAGYRVKVIDGNCVASTEHRLKVLRSTSAGPLPGKGLVIYDASTDLFEDCILCEDGHAQERSLFESWFTKLKAKQLWIDDRNFCTVEALFRIHAAGARFITREHATNAPWGEDGPRRELGRVETGVVYEQPVHVLRQDGESLPVRRVTLVLDVPTRDGETEIHVLTDLTEQELDGRGVAELYRRRWTIERAFLHLAMDLQSEIRTLGYPPAALFGFAVGVVAYNMVSTMKASIRAEHGREAAEQLSGYSVAQDIAATYEGMSVAVAEETWEPIATWTPDEVGGCLRRLARQVNLPRFKKAVRGPKKPKTPRTAPAGEKHVSTAQLLRAKKRGKAP
jgi:hypothetical protein